MKIFISQPMRGKSNSEIADKYKVLAKPHIKDGDIVLNNIFDFGDISPIVYLAESLRALAEADLVIMARGWEKARGCRIEHEVAVQYGKEIKYENL